MLARWPPRQASTALGYTQGQPTETVDPVPAPATPPGPRAAPVRRFRGVEYLEQDVVLPSADDAHVLRCEAVPHEAVTPEDHL